MLQQSVELGYLLNRIWLDDYCIWVQQQPARRIARLVDALGRVRLEKDAIGWPLAAYESIVLEEEGDAMDDEGSGDE